MYLHGTRPPVFVFLLNSVLPHERIAWFFRIQPVSGSGKPVKIGHAHFLSFLAGAELCAHPNGSALDGASWLLSLTVGDAGQLPWVDRPYGCDIL
jgi:hypothetical protein